MLPDIIKCNYCKVDLKLTFKDRIINRYICPKCKNSNYIRLPKITQCANCNTELELDIIERISGQYTCPVCSQDFKTSEEKIFNQTGDKKIQNYCTECGNAIDVEFNYCSRCGAKIHTRSDNKINDEKLENVEIKKVNFRNKFEFKYLYIFLLGVILHMTFVGENTLANYLMNTSSAGSERTISGLLLGLYGTFAYAGTGMIFSLIIFTPFVYFMFKKDERNIYKSLTYAICIGIVFRVLSYFI